MRFKIDYALRAHKCHKMRQRWFERDLFPANFQPGYKLVETAMLSSGGKSKGQSWVHSEKSKLFPFLVFALEKESRIEFSALFLESGKNLSDLPFRCFNIFPLVMYAKEGHWRHCYCSKKVIRGFSCIIEWISLIKENFSKTQSHNLLKILKQVHISQDQN